MGKRPDLYGDRFPFFVYCSNNGLCAFLELISVDQVYPMHTWETPSIIDAFIKDHPQYTSLINSEISR